MYSRRQCPKSRSVRELTFDRFLLTSYWRVSVTPLGHYTVVVANSCLEKAAKSKISRGARHVERRSLSLPDLAYAWPSDASLETGGASDIVINPLD